MDKIKKYQNILVGFLTDFAKDAHIANMPEVTAQVIADRERNSFQALHIGWDGPKFIFSPIFHFDIKDGKIWFQCNNTEREVVDVLIQMGVDKQDIVLGFQPPYARAYSGFAVA
ncbi:MAG: XisI protein [Saprospiraceae bacterium]